MSIAIEILKIMAIVAAIVALRFVIQRVRRDGPVSRGLGAMFVMLMNQRRELEQLREQVAAAPPQA